MAGLIDFMNSPAGQGLLSAAFGGLAGARRGTPINNIGRAGMAGLMGYTGAQDRERQALDDDMRRQFSQYQMQIMQAEAQRKQAAIEQAQKRQTYLGSLGKVTSPKVGAQPNQFDAMHWLSLDGDAKSGQDIAGAKDWGRPKVKDYKDVRGPDGSVSIVGLNEYGDTIKTGLQPFMKPEYLDMGGSRIGLDPVTNQRVWSGAKTATPGELLTNARSRDQLALGSKPPSGYRYTADGNMEAVPGGPADAKAQAAAQMKSAGTSDVDIAIGTLRDAYDRLEKGGGITSTKKSAAGNLYAWGSSSSLGQTIGKALGTDNQSARNDIAMTRPALLAALMRATGMNSKQIDTNNELKLWLATATDPTLDVESNRRALAKIELKYLSGDGASQSPGRQPANDDIHSQADAILRGGK